MSEGRFKNFLVNGLGAKDQDEDEDEDEIMDTTENDGSPGEEPEYQQEEYQPEAQAQEEYREEGYQEEGAGEYEQYAPQPDGLETRLASMDEGILQIRVALEELLQREPAMPDLSEYLTAREQLETAAAAMRPDMSPYLTTREQLKAVTNAVEHKDALSSNKALVGALEQIAVMREDFFRLCQSMRSRLGEMTAEDVLSSFEAYQVDMENILLDGGVYIGPFDYQRLNTIHQRIVGIEKTDDASKDGTIAERLSEGYKLGNKVLVKEKVTVYKYSGDGEKGEQPSGSTEEAPTDADTTETPCQEPIETDYEKPLETASEEVQGTEQETENPYKEEQE